MNKIGEMAAAFSSPASVKLVGCKICGKQVPSFSRKCSHCGGPAAAPRSARWFGLPAASIVSLAVLLAVAVAAFIRLM